MAMATTRTMTTMHRNNININQGIVCIFDCNSCRAAESIQRHANPWNIAMVFMDYIRSSTMSVTTLTLCQII
jgi:hypothetical protein